MCGHDSRLRVSFAERLATCRTAAVLLPLWVTEVRCCYKKCCCCGYMKFVRCCQPVHCHVVWVAQGVALLEESLSTSVSTRVGQGLCMSLHVCRARCAALRVVWPCLGGGHVLIELQQGYCTQWHAPPSSSGFDKQLCKLQDLLLPAGAECFCV